MIHRLPFSNFARAGVALGIALAMSACAGSGTQYPSFTIPNASEDTSRVAMRFPAVAVPEPREAEPVSEPLPAELDARLAAINNRAMAAAGAFSANLDATRALARAASPNAPESDSYAIAQLGIADLASHHSQTHLALADLDELAVTAQLTNASAEDAAMIAELRTNLANTLADQARLLADIAGPLDP